MEGQQQHQCLCLYLYPLLLSIAAQSSPLESITRAIITVPTSSSLSSGSIPVSSAGIPPSSLSGHSAVSGLSSSSSPLFILRYHHIS